MTMKNLRRTARRHQAVNSEIWYEFPPGLRVMTPDGIEGVVKDVEDGPYPGYEQYVVELDGGMGGGEYDSIELKMRCTGCGAWFGPDSQDSDITDLVTSDHAQNEHWNAEVDAFHERTVQTGTGGRVAANLARRCSALTKTADEDQCPYDGSDSIMEDGLYRCEMGDIWSLDDPAALRYHGDGPERGKIQPRTSMVRHATSDEARDWGWAGREDMDGEGFIEPPYAEDVQASLRVASEDYPELAQILVDRPPLPHSTRMGSLQTTAASIPAIPDWAILQQFSQYPPSGPEGVSYFKGEIDAENWVDCLLYYTGGRLVGVLNHFPKDMGPERKGNVLVMVHPEYRLQGIGRALWAEAVSRWGVTKQQDTSPDGAAFLNRMSALAGFWDRALEPVADRMLEKQQESGYGTYNPDTGAMASYDWCRFRHNRRCFYPKQLDEAATKQAGYAVWVPEDRGFCPREKWDAQKACPAPSEPGPNSGDPNWRYETWKSWADGGQGRYAHLGMPAMPHEARDIEQSIKDIPKPPPPPDYEGEAYRAELAQVVEERKREKNPYAVSSLAAHLTEGEFGFHMTATWREVQAKAKKIRSEGHVRIISASTEYLVGQVQGETNVYQTSLMREPGTKRVAMWECGCAWAAYSWGRSGRWKKFEGRLCSHALALNYEAQSRGWAGRTVSEDTRPPGWLTDQKVIVPGDYQRGPIGEWRKAVRLPPATAGLTFTAMPAGTFSSYEDVAAWLYGQAKQAEPAVTNLLRTKASEHFGEMQGLNFRFKEPDSIARKLKTKGVDPTSAFDPFEKVKDALRYTVALPEPDWANSVQNILWAVQGAGYRITEEENTWARGDSYSGLHYNFQTPVGLVFEVQFHTASSYDLKDKVLHKMYEEFRNPATPLQRRQQLWDEMTKYWDDIPIPDNALAFPGEKSYLRPVAVTAREVVLDSEVAGRPVDAVFAALLDDGLDAHEASVVLESAGISAEAMSAQPFRGIVRGLITEIVDLFDDGTVETRQGRVPASEVLYPTYHPTRGLTAAKTAATALPEGYTLQYTRGGNVTNFSVAAIFEGKVVGAIQWVPEREVWGGQRQPDGSMESVLIKRPPQIVDLKVQPQHQRKGLATAMYEEAKRHEPDLVHDDIVLPDGEEWMKSLTSAHMAAEGAEEIVVEPRGHLWGWRCAKCGETEVGTGRSGKGYAEKATAREYGENHAMVCWDLGWGDSVNIREAAKTAGTITLYRGEGSHERPTYYPTTGPEAWRAGAWWTSDLDKARDYAKSTMDGQVYVIEVDESEAQAQGATGNYVIRDPKVRERRRLYTEAKTASADLDGYMLAIEVPDAVKDALHTLCEARYGGDVEPKDNYHVTVLYPGKADDVDADAFTAAALEWANRWSPMTGRISGFGVFHQEGGDKVLYASVNIPGLDRARDDLVDILSSYGVVVPDDYGFTPHLTLGYFGEANTPQPPEQMEDDVLSAEFPIEAVTLALGGNWRQIPLAGAVVSQEKVAGIVDDAMDLLSFGNDLGLVDADAVRWYSGNEAGQAAAQADMVGWGGDTSPEYGPVVQRETIPPATADWAEIIADQFNAENPPLGDGCEVCGDSGHSTEQHIADPVKYDDGTRTASKDTNVPPSEHGDPRLQDAGVSVKRTDKGKYYVCTHRARGKYRDSVADIPDSEIEFIRSTGSASEAELKDEPEAALPETTAEEESVEDIVAAFQQTAAGKALAGGGVAKAGEAGDVALAAKQALKAFSPAEQKQIIDEGEGVTAANLADLDIRGTHYMQLEEALREAEEGDAEWLY